MATEETTFKDLGINCIANIFSRLSPKECGQAGCVSLLWQHAAAEDVLWKPHLAADFATSSRCTPDGAEVASYRSAYAAWHTTYADVAGPMLTRALAAWNNIKDWLRVYSPRILQSLNPGATAEQVSIIEAALGHPLPIAMRCIYRVHNGQRLCTDQQSCEEGPPADLLMGLFGCVAFYDHISSNQLLPLNNALKITKVLRTMRPLGAGQTLLSSSEVIFAHSFRVSDKLCAIDCNTGAVMLKLAHRDWPLAPPQDTHPEAFDGLLRWFEEYAGRLSAGVYGTCTGESTFTDSGLNEAQAISLFPRAHPLAATAITRGVKVTWSSVFVPQESRQGRLMFAYSVRFSMLTPQQQQAALLQLASEQHNWQQQQQQHSTLHLTAPAGANQEAPDLPGDSTTAGTSGTHAAKSTAADAAPAGPSAPNSSSSSTPEASAAAAAMAAAAAAAAGSGVISRQGRHQGAAAAAGAAAPLRQAIVLGPCAASAGPAAVPPALAAAAPWEAAVAAEASLAAAAGSTAAGTAGRCFSGAADAGGTSGGSSGGSSNGKLAAAEAEAAAPSSWQLESRHWVIYDAHGSRIDSVDGEGVVGLYPLLYPGNEPFAYASCTPCPVPEIPPEPAASSADGTSSAAAAATASSGPPSSSAQGLGSSGWVTGPGRLSGCVVGAMEGSFSFVQGSLMQRSGGAFSVQCPRLVFAVPDYIF